MAIGTKTFSDISRATFEHIKNDLRSLGVNVPSGDDCIIEHRGARGSLAYSEATGRLEVSILEKPLFVPESAVWALLDRAMQRYGAPAPDSDV
ncbi:MAG: hypothetical protein GEV06_08635 [Luteitalea sp.]|nr:hypothetical protein [Luteitalea sp.]